MYLFVVCSDDSKKRLGGILMQEGKLVAYASRLPKIHKHNYPTHYFEFGAVVFTLKV